MNSKERRKVSGSLIHLYSLKVSLKEVAIMETPNHDRKHGFWFKNIYIYPGQLNNSVNTNT